MKIKFCNSITQHFDSCVFFRCASHCNVNHGINCVASFNACDIKINITVFETFANLEAHVTNATKS